MRDSENKFCAFVQAVAFWYWGKNASQKPRQSFVFQWIFTFSFQNTAFFCELSVTSIPNLNSCCGSCIVYMFADHTVFWDLLSQHSECAAANGNVGGASAEGFAFSINYWNPKTRNEPEQTSSALLCICLWPRSKSKDAGLISQFCTHTPAIFSISAPRNM